MFGFIASCLACHAVAVPHEDLQKGSECDCQRFSKLAALLVGSALDDKMVSYALLSAACLASSLLL